MGDCPSTKRELFDLVSCRFLSQLESIPEVSKIDFSAKEAIDEVNLLVWERDNLPYKVPLDLFSFYELFNGVTLSWEMGIGGRTMTVGQVPCSLTKFSFHMKTD